MHDYNHQDFTLRLGINKHRINTEQVNAVGQQSNDRTGLKPVQVSWLEHKQKQAENGENNHDLKRHEEFQCPFNFILGSCILLLISLTVPLILKNLRSLTQ